MPKARNIIAVVVLAALAVGGCLTHSHRQREEADNAFRQQYEERLVSAIHYYYLAEGRLPGSWEQLEKSGCYRPDTRDIDAMISLGHNTSGQPNPFRAFQEDVFAKAIVAAAQRQGQWDSQVQAMRKRWRDHAGDLRRQLSLLLDPEFDPLAVLPLLEELCRTRNIPQATLVALVDAAGKVRISQLYLDHPERAINHPDYIPITRARAQEELSQARDDVDRLFNQIMEYDKPAATRPTTDRTRR